MDMKKSSILIFAIIIAALIPSFFIIFDRHEQKLLSLEKSKSKIQLQLFGNAIVNSLSRRSALFEGLCTFVESNPHNKNLETELDRLMDSLYHHSKGIRVMAIAPGGIQKYVYPLKDHESVVGHDILHDKRPHVQADIQRALKTKKIIFNGPYELRQGGVALVMRKAIYFENKFWGLAAMVIDIPPVLKEAGLAIRSESYDIWLKNNHGTTFSGIENDDRKDSIKLSLDILDGTWKLFASPTNGWNFLYAKDLFFYKVSLVTIVFLILMVGYLFVSRNIKLKFLVEEKTKKLTETIADLEESRSKFKFISESIDDVFWMSSVGVTNMIYISPSFETLWESSCGELYKNPRLFIDKIHPDDTSNYIRKLEQHHSNGLPYECEYRIIKNNRDVLWIHEKGFPVSDPTNNSKVMAGICSNITEQKFSEKLAGAQLELSMNLGLIDDLDSGLRQCLHTALNTSEMDCGAIYLIDEETKNLNLMIHKGLSNEVISHTSKYENDSQNTRLILKGQPIYVNYNELTLEFTEPEKKEHLQAIAIIPIKYQDQVLGCMNIASRSKEMVPESVRVILETISNQIGQSFIHLKTQTELQKSEKRFDIAMEATKDGLYDWDLVTNTIYYSPGWKRMLGYRNDELPNDFSIWEKLTDSKDVKRSWEMQQELINKKRDRFELEFKMKHKEGHWVDILSRAIAIFNKNDEAIRIVGTHVDISERKKYENELRVKDAAIENSLSGFDIVNEEGKLIYANPAFVSMYGYDNSSELIGVSPADLCEDPSLPLIVIKNLKEKGEYVFEHKAKRKDGSTFDILMYARLAHDENGKEIYPTTSIDISDQKKAAIEKEILQQKLVQAQKMESIGKLAGGIAHDFNNILYPILGFTQMSMDELPKNHPVQENLLDVLDGAKRARDLVKRILMFSRQKEQILKPTQIKPIIEESLKLLRSSIPVNIEIQTQLYDGKDHILCDETEIHEIVMNLCTNAYHAIENVNGIIKVELKKRNPSSDLDLHKADYLCLSISDNGTGIVSENKQNIFEPYFTTKEIGKGSGLGLSVVHGIVENYEGKIQVESSPGKGSTFNVFLPITSKKMKSENDHKKAVAPGYGEKILFVDDEESIVKLGTKSLEKMGYQVTGMHDSSDALKLVTSKPNEFNLVITDMAMPGLVGTELAKKILEIQPKMPIILCSGFSEKLEREQAKLLNIKAFIDKPILIDELTIKVKEIFKES